MQLRQLRIRNFRNFENLCWQPGPGTNALIGPGDAGKSTILAAIDLLLSPAPLAACHEFDFHKRRVEAGFEIEGVLTGNDLADVFAGVVPPLWGWRNGALRELLDEPAGDAPAVACRVSGSPELELEYALLEPSGDTRPFGVALRRRLYAGHLSATADPGRELRATQGTLLTRHLGRTEGLRAALTSALRRASSELTLTDDLITAVQTLGQTLASRNLASDVSLGLVAHRAGNLLGLASLMEGTDEEALPVHLAGSGTTRMTLLALAAELVGENPILAVDELEQGLEPYRQRQAVHLIREVSGSNGQAFITTHAAPVLGAVTAGTDAAPAVHRVTRDQVVSIKGSAAERLMRNDPDAFFARLPLLCEGETEYGFLSQWLPRRWERNLDDLGVHLVYGKDLGGNRANIDLANALLDLDFDVAAFLDDEHTDKGRRQALSERCPVFSWIDNDVRNIEEATAKYLPPERGPMLFATASEVKDVPETQLITQVWEFTNRTDNKPDDASELIETLGQDEFRHALAKAMQAGKKGWFKSVEGGQRLADVLTDGGLPSAMAEQLDPFAKLVQQKIQ